MYVYYISWQLYKWVYIHILATNAPIEITELQELNFTFGKVQPKVHIPKTSIKEFKQYYIQNDLNCWTNTCDS